MSSPLVPGSAPGPSPAPPASPETAASLAVSRLRQLAGAVSGLFPGAEAVPLRGKEAERLAALERATLALAARPRAPERAGDGPLLLQAAALRRQAAAALGLLGGHARAEVGGAIERSLLHWDQAGDLALLTAEGRAAALSLHEACDAALRAALAQPGRGPGALALLLSAAEASAAIDAACALLRAFELRFVILLRERLLQSGARGAAAEREALLPGGVPFCDLGGALCAAAAAFGWQGGEDGAAS